MDENNELQDSQTPVEDGDSLESLATPETVDESKFQELAEKNKKLFERAKKAEEDRKKLREQLAASTPKAEPATPQADSSLSVKDVLELRRDGFTDSEILDLEKQARDLGAPISSVLKNPIFKAGLEAQREKAKFEQATPTPSSGFSRKIEGKTWAEMTNDERKNNFEKVMRGGK